MVTANETDPLQILLGDCREILPTLEPESVQCCVSSPPYWGLRDYGTNGQLGLEPTPEEYITNMVAVFREVWRVLRDDGTLWVNMGDSYVGGGNGLKPKDLCGIPWRLVFAMQADGWYLRSDIIWHKPNPMPESVTDRPTRAHEYIFLLTKQERYFYDADAIREPNTLPIRNPGGYCPEKACGPQSRSGRNKRSVWTVATQPYSEAHFATFPEEIPKLCILAGSKPGDTILDPFLGSGTTCKVALELGRKAIGIELNPEYIELAKCRCQTTPGLPLTWNSPER